MPIVEYPLEVAQGFRDKRTALKARLADCAQSARVISELIADGDITFSEDWVRNKVNANLEIICQLGQVE